MPPKKKAKSKAKDAKNGESAQPSKSSVNRTSASERAQARAANLTFLKDALDAVKAENRTEDYSSSGHVFVTVDSSKSYGQFDDHEQDPLNLSQKDCEGIPETPSSVKTPVFLPPAPPSSLLSAKSTPFQLPSTSKSLSPISSSATSLVPKFKSRIAQEALASTSTSHPPASSCMLQASTNSPPAAHSASVSSASPAPIYQATQALTSSPKSLLPASSFQSSPAAPVPSASSPEAFKALSVSPTRSSLVPTLPIPQPEYVPTDSLTVSPPQSPLQPMNDSTDNSDTDNGGMDEKYAKLLAKHQKQTELLKASRKKNENFKVQLAEMKDLVVDTVAEAKKARTGENTNTTFLHDPDVNMSVAQIANINGISKSVPTFAQNLALHLYGAENLRERTVKGRSSNRMKNTPEAPPARPAISPKKLDFIYAKARERVALEVGQNNLGLIKTLSHESVINKAIAEKIANLRKASAKHVERRVDNNAA